MEWKPIETAPKDGRDVDLQYPTNKGVRIVRCRWLPATDRFPYQAGFVNVGANGSIGIVCNVAPTHWREAKP